MIILADISATLAVSTLLPALPFLITIGITIFMERTRRHVEKASLRLPTGFDLGEELPQMRHSRNKWRHEAKA